MKNTLLSVILLAAAAAVASAGTSFKLLSVGDDVDAAALRDYMQEQGGVAVTLGGAYTPADPAAALDAIGRAAVADTADDGTYAVILFGRFGTDRPQGVCLPAERFAILNLDRLESAGDPAKVGRRAGQEGLRVMSMLLDMPACPFPLCVLVGYQKTEDLDRMSGNFCPPCHEQFLKTAADKGLELLPAPAVE